MQKITYIILSSLLFLYGCSKEDFEIPEINNKEIPTGNLLSLKGITANLDSREQNISTFTVEDQFVEGYVISSDKEGNFFKELIIQDTVESPTIGVVVLLDERALYQRYPFGTKIRIRLKGLSIGFKNGVVSLGILKESEIEAIDFSSIDNHVFRTTETKEIKPLPFKLEDLKANDVLKYVTVDNLQFNQNLLFPELKTLAGEVADKFDGLRAMQQCASGVELMLCTSTFASFKNVDLPQSSGTITGIITRDFGDDFFVFKINSIAHLNFNEQERCDPVFFECNTTNNFSATEVLFKEDFETITNENKLDPLGWFNINTTRDEKRWVDKKVINVANRVLSISAQNTNLRPLEAWLITPEINLENTINAYLQFRIRTRFNTGKALDVWITEDFSGNPLTTKWKHLPVVVPILSSNFKIIQQDISCFKNKVRLAFQYKGYDPIITSTYEVDDVQILGIKKE